MTAPVPSDTCTIFYSWQSQLPNAVNRGFIEKALDVAARAVREDASIDARPDVDQDTENVPGSPNIADIIRRKIDAAEIVICDVTIVQGLDGDGERVRPTPNPNVLIELGYAMRSLGTTDRLVLVMNTAYGGIDKLPFDLRQYRPTTYQLAEGATNDEKAIQRRALASKLEATFRHVLKSPSRHVATQSLTAVDRLNAIPPENRESVVLVYRPLNREDMPHEVMVEFIGVDVTANVFHFKSTMGSRDPLDHRAPLGDVEEVWQPEPGRYAVRLSGYLGKPEPLKPYRYYSRPDARNGVGAEPRPRDTGVDDLMTGAAKHLMSQVTLAYVNAGYPAFETWWFQLPPGNETTALELRGHRLIEERPARPGEMGWGFTDAGQTWAMSHRDR